MFIGIPQKESKSGFHPDLSVLIGHVVTEHVETRITESPFQVPFLLALQFMGSQRVGHDSVTELN